MPLVKRGRIIPYEQTNIVNIQQAKASSDTINRNRRGLSRNLPRKYIPLKKTSSAGRPNSIPATVVSAIKAGIISCSTSFQGEPMDITVQSRQAPSTRLANQTFSD